MPIPTLRAQVFLLAVLVGGCAPEVLTPVVCSAETCADGCCQGGYCRRPSIGSCGMDGEACMDCSARSDADTCGPNGCICELEGAPCETGKVCQGGRCVACVNECCPSCAGKCAGADDGCGGTCAASQCDGCCTADAKCIALADQHDDACGAGGARCADCIAPETCGGGGQDYVCGCVPDCAGRCGGMRDGCGGICDEPCDSYTWIVDAWGACSAPCGPGISTRKVQCRRGDGVIVSDTLCPIPKPVVAQSCDLGACCVPNCDGKCGGASDGCGGSCDTPCATYAWIQGAWSACSAECGGGSQTRSVQCQRSDGVIVSDASCSGPKPATIQSCNGQACATYAWSAGAWGACSAACGGGSQTRVVQCLRNDGGVVADAMCAGPKPATSQACNTQACLTHAWLTGAWSGCSAACGGGTMTRAVQCQRSDGAIVADAMCSGAKPIGAQSCNTQPCLTYAWETGGWSGCSATCGDGQASRWVGCRRSDGVVVADGYCSGPRPESTEACYVPCCPPNPGGHVFCWERAEFDAAMPCLSTEAVGFYYTYYIVGGNSLAEYRSMNRTGTCADYCAARPSAAGCSGE